MTIVIKTDDLINGLQEIINEQKDAIELTIEDNTLYLATLECGGLGCCMDYDAIKGMTPEEILDIP